MEFVDREEITMVSGASAGIFTGYSFAADKLDWLEDIYCKIDIHKTSELFWQVFAKRLVSKYINAMSANEDKLTIPFCFPVCYIPIYSVRYYWIFGRYNRAWRKYFRAAINYPFLQIIPSFINGRLAIDGGAADNIPLFPLLHKSRPILSSEKLDLVFVLHFDARYDWHKDFVTDVPVIDLDLGICNGFEKAHYDYSEKTIRQRIDSAYEYGKKICGRLFEGDCSQEGLQKTINEIFIEEHAVRQQNISIDRFFSMLNIIGRFVRSDSHCTQKLF